ncbi:hypothetical protein N657DRAFT_375835 [Parathielavia appendiculata]|uniref:Uncharacterized protein n=1 Tax=Parathielavia appendiculata TaxID=2587402 RepID=A0AAN6U0E9_9PEZI|nr:hypothetical protein N657DRAFT_375835 [Parathielavia appendiculata]
MLASCFHGTGSATGLFGTPIPTLWSPSRGDPRCRWRRAIQGFLFEGRRRISSVPRTTISQGRPGVEPQSKTADFVMECNAIQSFGVFGLHGQVSDEVDAGSRSRRLAASSNSGHNYSITSVVHSQLHPLRFSSDLIRESNAIRTEPNCYGMHKVKSRLLRKSVSMVSPLSPDDTRSARIAVGA